MSMSGAAEASHGTLATKKVQEQVFKTPDEETEAVDGRRHVAAGGRAAKEIEGKPDTVAVMLKLMWKECKCYKKRCWQDPAKELTRRRPSRPRWSCRSCFYGIRSQAHLTSLTGYRREGGKGPGGDGEEPPKCRFYLTESGCRKGRSCDWSHDQTDGRRRCYACASPEHMAPECPRGSSNSPTSSTTRPRIAKAEDEKKPAMADDGSDTSSVKPADETMQPLLQEANRLLKGLQEKDKQPACLQRTG